jgi:hypothetical protein
MTNPEERMNWEVHKNNRIKSIPAPPDMNRTCYELFDSFDEFVMNGSPYHLNGCGGLPPKLEQTESFSVPMFEYNEQDCRQVSEPVITNQDDGISLQTDAALWSQATGIPFIPYQGNIGAEQMRLMREMNQGYRW